MVEGDLEYSPMFKAVLSQSLVKVSVTWTF